MLDDRLKDHRMQMLSEIAEYYAETYCPQSLTIIPQEIANALQLEYRTNDYNKAFDGLLYFRQGKFYLHLNLRSGDHLFMPRVRFTFAHELGHYIIDEHRNALMTGAAKPHCSFPLVSRDLLVEREADHFAACLLMPENRIRRDVFKRKFNAALLTEISAKYNVSITAALLRLVALGNHPIMVVCSRSGMVKWSSHSYDFPFTYLQNGYKGRVPENTSAGEYFSDHVKYTTTETVMAGDWFSLHYEADEIRKFYEHCFYFEAMKQVVSVIWED